MSKFARGAGCLRADRASETELRLFRVRAARAARPLKYAPSELLSNDLPVKTINSSGGVELASGDCWINCRLRLTRLVRAQTYMLP